MKILLTAFDPFGGHGTNPALEAVNRVRGEIGGCEVVKKIVPTVFGDAIRAAAEEIDRCRPDAVLCVGLAGGSTALCVERVAINVDDAIIPDNRGNQPIDQPVVPGGPPAIFSTLPIKAMVRAIQEAGLPAQVSNSAGTFVCNHLMYGVLHHIQRRGLETRAGFLHVPCTPELTVQQPERPSMALDDIVRGLEAAVGAVVENESDIVSAGGALF